jgi:hypothetical protein
LKKTTGRGKNAAEPSVNFMRMRMPPSEEAPLVMQQPLMMMMAQVKNAK